MRMPSRVRIGAHDYRIAMMPKEHSALANGVDEPLQGLCEFNTCIIYLQRGMAKTKTQGIFLHEINHAAMYPNHIGVTMTDEVFVSTVSPVMLQVIRDNPHLMEYFQK